MAIDPQRAEYLARIAAEKAAKNRSSHAAQVAARNSYAAPKPSPKPAYKPAYSVRAVRSCRTGGNCSSFGSGRSCGAPDCDGY